MLPVDEFAGLDSDLEPQDQEFTFLKSIGLQDEWIKVNFYAN